MAPFYGALVASAFLMTGCSHGDSPGTTAASGSGGEQPAIHFEQTAVLMVDGQPTEENAYRTVLASCEKTGRPMHALSAEETGKIGRLHVDSWISQNKQRRHEEEWHLASPSLCQFDLTHKDHTEIVDANGRSTMIDNVSHTADVQETGEPAPLAAVADGDGAMDDAAKQAGWIKKADSSANGAPCSVWQNALGFEECVWNGGGAWGYSSYGVDALKDGMSQGQSIVLWAHPGKGSAWQLETAQFSVGTAPPGDAFAIPGNVTTSPPSP